MTETHLPHDHGQHDESVLACMPAREAFVEAAELFDQLSDGSRLRILYLLCHTEECVYNIAAAVGMSNAAVSHHLRSLQLHGVITSRRVGREVYYTLAKNERGAFAHRFLEEYFKMECPNCGQK